jgi:hypothetical protein
MQQRHNVLTYAETFLTTESICTVESIFCRVTSQSKTPLFTFQFCALNILCSTPYITMCKAIFTPNKSVVLFPKNNMLFTIHKTICLAHRTLYCCQLHTAQWNFYLAKNNVSLFAHKNMLSIFSS